MVNKRSRTVSIPEQPAPIYDQDNLCNFLDHNRNSYGSQILESQIVQEYQGDEAEIMAAKINWLMILHIVFWERTNGRCHNCHVCN